MPAPLGRMKKKEIMWLHNNLCRAHSMSYLSHFGCYEKEVLKGRRFNPGENIPINIRDGFFDIESSGFSATFCIMFCYCIKDGDSDKIYERVVTKRELSTSLDKKVVEQCVKDLKNFDRIISFYGSRFDLPFLRSRAVYWEIPFPHYHDLLHTDVYYIVRNKFKLGRNSLESACNFLLPEEVQDSHPKFRFGRDHWVWAAQGRKDSLNFMIEHCRNDVKMLEDLYYVVMDYTQRRDTSI